MNKNFWETDRIRLRGVEPEDWKVHYEWDMDSEMVRGLNALHFRTSKASTKKWAEEASVKRPTGDNYHMEIELITTNEIIGVASTNNCDKRNGTFSFGVAIRDQFARQGYASEASILLMRYMFDELRYQKCTNLIYSWNEPSIALHEKLGFIKEGQIRRGTYSKGNFHDKLYYGITIEEFHERYN